MKAQLSLERINDSADLMMRQWTKFLDGKAEGCQMPWVAELVGEHPRFGFERTFLDWNKDFAGANSAGSRGVMAVYILETGRVYEVKEKTSRKNSRRYFCRVTEEGEVQEITKTEVLTHLAHHEIDTRIIPALKEADGNHGDGGR